MIITCPNCKKKFNIDPTLIPEDGRDLKCGSCNHVWLYKIEDVSSKPLTLNENNDNNKIEPDKTETGSNGRVEKNQPIHKKINNIDEDIRTKKFKEKQKTISKNTGGKFFSYLIVFIITFVALIILLDTLKTPLINVFPGFKIILFNLFETLQDIKLFIIDLI